MKVKVSVNDNEYEEIMSHQKITGPIEFEDNCDPMLKFKAFVGHHGLLLSGHAN
jgi:hypothetical protein